MCPPVRSSMRITKDLLIQLLADRMNGKLRADHFNQHSMELILGGNAGGRPLAGSLPSLKDS